MCMAIPTQYYMYVLMYVTHTSLWSVLYILLMNTLMQGTGLELYSCDDVCMYVSTCPSHSGMLSGNAKEYLHIRCI